jgi:hypothetical protein
MCAFKNGDRIRRKSEPDITDIVLYVPGDVEYDSYNFGCASEGFMTIYNSWEWQKDWEVIEPTEAAPKEELKIGDYVVAKSNEAEFEGYYVGNCHDRSKAEILIETLDSSEDVAHNRFDATGGHSTYFTSTLPRGYVNRSHGVFAWVESVSKVDEPKQVETHGGFKEGDTVLYTGTTSASKNRVKGAPVRLGEFDGQHFHIDCSHLGGSSNWYALPRECKHIQEVQTNMVADTPEPATTVYVDTTYPLSTLNFTIATPLDDYVMEPEQQVSFFKSDKACGWVGSTGDAGNTGRWSKLLNK